MKILGMGVPELLIALVVIGIPVIVVAIVVTRNRKKNNDSAIPFAGNVQGEAPASAWQPLSPEQACATGSAQAAQQSAPPACGAAPVLETWKTSVGFSLLGALVGFPLAMMLMLLLASFVSFGVASGIGAAASMAPEVVSAVSSALVTPIAFILFYVLSIVYATVFYPSYFGGKPKVRSSRAISFLNLVFGFVIFGALWNSSLTKKSKGSSHVVLVVLTALMLVGMVFSAGATVVQGLSYNATASAPSTSESTSAKAAPATASAGDISFAYPEDWALVTEADVEDLSSAQILGQSPQSLSSVGPKEDAGIVFTAYYVPDFEYSYDSLKAELESVEQFDTEVITINGREAIKASQVGDGIMNVIVIPNIDGKVTSVFGATYPDGDAGCSAVVDSLTVR